MLLKGAVPSATGVAGLLAPLLERHALVLAAHAWTHGPLIRLRDLLDVALMTAKADRDELERLAEDWGIWARNLSAARERTVLEQHVARWVGWHAALPRRLAAGATLDELRDDLTPERGESWGASCAARPAPCATRSCAGRTTSAAAS